MEPLDVLFSRFQGKYDASVFTTMLAWLLLNLISALFHKGILTEKDIKNMDESVTKAQMSAIKNNP